MIPVKQYVVEIDDFISQDRTKVGLELSNDKISTDILTSVNLKAYKGSMFKRLSCFLEVFRDKTDFNLFSELTCRRQLVCHHSVWLV